MPFTSGLVNFKTCTIHTSRQTNIVRPSATEIAIAEDETNNSTLDPAGPISTKRRSLVKSLKEVKDLVNNFFL
ncbi:hypothetical protein BCR33DRAFT_717531 [Rhizoclosmatium globosum]|uniref:Uncharacterized protein n=1 Tax=Rhizoclosmatium globosum TaxID=329046 RepID=A0A1Y2C8C8_9FUNG|nr:hypothetical protein BCR33DRAFT_717531 [Rhizoclosmatium globosum]|eukprot:ORY43290.1 hypothetical protein BCR33DRAFT_717531 [Rhizoclosmatium globosum]